MTMAEQKFGMHLNVEFGTLVMLDVKGIEGKMKSILVGEDPSEYLIVKSPVGYAGVRRQLFEGNKVTVRYVQHGHVYAFESFILALVKKPTNLLFLDYPTNVMHATLRKNERFDCYISCNAQFNNIDHNGTIMDVSITGCRCLLASHSHSEEGKAPETGQEIVLNFESPENETRMEITARVINVTDYHSAARLGVQFTNIAGEAQRRIKNLTNFLAIQ